jgi:Protein of unknown function (DUF2637)
MKTIPPGRGWAYTGAAIGGLVSIAANVGHSYVAPPAALPGWRPEPGAVVGAVVWPVFLFVAIEILARTAWPRGWSWMLLRWGGLLPVAGVAAFVSYRHLSGLLAHYGEEPLVTIVGPLAVDGLMVVATAALVATGSRRAATPAAPPATPPVMTDDRTPDAPPVMTAPAPRPAPALEKVQAARRRHPDAPQDEIARKAGVAVRTAARHWQAAAPDTPAQLNGSKQ